MILGFGVRGFKDSPLYQKKQISLEFSPPAPLLPGYLMKTVVLMTLKVVLGSQQMPNFLEVAPSSDPPS